ncbi:hypothetical protein Mterra_03120 [Calidithermus terrae]|uniref:Uncharacterized protein n=1 Tax=Calidithermus terrae TaxID=1408545 RepID=A0A399EES9_9DEIN|nr:hypothetical protein [Calidithermus terrae]RIH81500.1 hypothetical protein Mterra_03120 [Calidithermus terrae]
MDPKVTSNDKIRKESSGFAYFLRGVIWLVFSSAGLWAFGGNILAAFFLIWGFGHPQQPSLLEQLRFSTVQMMPTLVGACAFIAALFNGIVSFIVITTESSRPTLESKLDCAPEFIYAIRWMIFGFLISVCLIVLSRMTYFYDIDLLRLGVALGTLFFVVASSTGISGIVGVVEKWSLGREKALCSWKEAIGLILFLVTWLLLPAGYLMQLLLPCTSCSS